jgi:hypothetical protein
MRIRTIIDTVYTFDELDDDTQQKVIEKFAQQNMEWYEASDLTDQFEQVLEEYGFPHEDINWSLSWSQGDGVAFYGTFDIYKYLRVTKQRTKFNVLLKPDIYIDARFVRSSYANFYSHENTMITHVEAEHSQRELTALEVNTVERLKDQVIEDKERMSRRLERMGYDEFRYISSEEYIKEQIEANAYEFTWEGSIA